VDIQTSDARLEAGVERQYVEWLIEQLTATDDSRQNSPMATDT